MIQFGMFDEMKIIRFHSYRKARVFGITIECDAKTTTKIKNHIEEQGYKMDNHICWEYDNLKCMYSDHVLTIGTEISIKNW